MEMVAFSRVSIQEILERQIYLTDGNSRPCLPSSRDLRDYKDTGGNMLREIGKPAYEKKTEYIVKHYYELRRFYWPVCISAAFFSILAFTLVVYLWSLILGS